MRDQLLVQLNNDILSMIAPLEKTQALALAGLSLSRLWYPYKVWAVQNKAPKLIEYGENCLDILWKQIADEQIYGADFETFYRYSDRIQDQVNRLEDRDIIAEGSTAWPFLEALDTALCCFYDPKLLPGLQGGNFKQDIMVIVGQAAEYIYDGIYSNLRELSENESRNIVQQDQEWQDEYKRIHDDVALVKLLPQNKREVLIRQETYRQLHTFQEREPPL